MDWQRVGRSLRALRLHRGLRQSDLAVLAGVSRWTIGRLERGDTDELPVGRIGAVARALGAELDVLVRWNGVELDRLLNAGHSAMHEAIVGTLEDRGWEVMPEVSFSIWGERGVIDLLGWRLDAAPCWWSS